MMDATMQKRIGLTVGAVGVLACIGTAGGTLWFTTDQNRRQDAIIRALDATVHEANRRIIAEGGQPVDPPPVPVPDDERELQEPEVQEPEVQQFEFNDPEIQELERQDPEAADAETQDPDVDDPETQDVEVQDSEEQEPEEQEAEQQDAEAQDPEIDDPDPNSLLTFGIDDQCTPANGHYVTDYSARWVREGDTLTLVLTCTAAPAPHGPQPTPTPSS
jgi:type IV secretory pathway VirB10-like protein